MEQRFSAGKNNLANAEMTQRRSMPIKIRYPDLLMDLPLPDIAHDAAAVAVGMDIQN
jgi:hypothetical protein